MKSKHRVIVAPTPPQGDFGLSPLDQPVLFMQPRVRAAVQVFVSAAFVLALYLAYQSTQKMLDATPRTTEVRGAPAVPGWLLLLVPMVALIPAVYIFLFLKYNWNF